MAEEVSPSAEEAGNNSLELVLRSQRLSDTYPVRLDLLTRNENILFKLYYRTSSQLIALLAKLLFPKVLQNMGIISLLFKKSSQQIVRSSHPQFSFEMPSLTLNKY